MIFELIFQVLITVIKGVFGILPNLPPMSETVTNAGDAIIGLIDQPIRFLKYIYGPILLNAIFATIIILFNFEKIFYSLMFIVKKLPFLNIK